jgi:hypothetical protein
MSGSITLRKTLSPEDIAKTVGPLLRHVEALRNDPSPPDTISILLPVDSRAREGALYGPDLEQFYLPLEEARRDHRALSVLERMSQGDQALFRPWLACLRAPRQGLSSVWNEALVPMLRRLQEQWSVMVSTLYIVPHEDRLSLVVLLTWNVLPAGAVSRDEVPVMALVFSLGDGGPFEEGTPGAVVLPWRLQGEERAETMPHHRAKHKVAPWRSLLAKTHSLLYVGMALVDPALVGLPLAPVTHFDADLLS